MGVEVCFTTKDAVNDAVEGAVISHIEIGDRGAMVSLTDGRMIIFAECECYAVVNSAEILQ